MLKNSPRHLEALSPGGRYSSNPSRERSCNCNRKKLTCWGKNLEGFALLPHGKEVVGLIP